MADQGARHFLPWVRQGSAAGIAVGDSLGANQAAKISLPVTLRFGEFDVSSTVQLYGPADVTAIDPSQITRIEPRPFTTDYPYNLFPAIEFDRPDFPWLFTPAAAGLNERLRPWVCLVVVKKQDGVNLARKDGGVLPVLEIAAPAQPALELPNPDESWAWVHAQINGAIGDSAAVLKNAVTQAPERTLGRLICPRRLEPATAYLACVVPAFEVGRKTGLGLSVTESELAQLAPAWQGNATSVSLPAYFTWEFSTADTADFESLVRLLKPRPIDERVGTLTLDISTPGFGLSAPSDGLLDMRGVLQPVALADVAPQAVPSSLQSELVKILNAPADARDQSVIDPVVAPPIYGSSYPPKDRVELPPVAPLWVSELNLDPRHRIAAALGTQIVQEDQETLMASAWQQAEALRQANLQQRRNQLALVTRAATFTKQISRLDNDELLQITGPSMAKVPAAGPPGLRTAAAQVSFSASPAFSVSALRRIARPRGPINRRFLSRDFMATQNRRMVQLLNVLPPAVRRPGLPIGIILQSVSTIISIRKVSNAAGLPAIDAARLTPANVQSEPARGFFIWKTDPTGQIPGHWERSSVAFGQQLRQAAFDHLNRVMRAKPIFNRQPVIPDAASLLGKLNPQAVQPTSLSLARGAGSEDDPVVAYPEFPRPMAERLIEHAPEFLLPGLDQVPPNTVTLVKANGRFIEAFMIGLNHEMGRELLWREYPTDRRGSYFKKFWDEGGEDVMSLPPLNTWNQELGENTNQLGTEPLILLVRGQLFRRYPNAILYAAKAERDTAGRIKPGASERFPVFRGVAPPDVTFFGFQMSESEARGSAQPGDLGWFFVIQQQPGEPEFGLDVDPGGDPAPVTQWNQLTWRHLVRSQAELASLTHVKIAQGNPPRPDTQGNPPGAAWGFNGAHMARITLQQPVRIAILANQMLPPPGDQSHG